MQKTGFYPVILTDNVSHTTDFFVNYFQFEIVFQIDWYVSMQLEGSELAVLSHTHETIPADVRNKMTGNVILNLEVTDVDAMYSRLVHEKQLPLALDIRNEDFGQRHFIVSGPQGILVDIIQPIAPSTEYQKYFNNAL